jgi:hypothetical protein
MTRAALVLALLAAAFSAAAEDASGRVRAIYYEAARGVLVEGSMLRGRSGVRWLDVELANRQRTLVPLPADMQAKVGDVVALQLPAPKGLPLAGFEPIRVTRITEVRPSTQLAAPSN